MLTGVIVKKSALHSYFFLYLCVCVQDQVLYNLQIFIIKNIITTFNNDYLIYKYNSK